MATVPPDLAATIAGLKDACEIMLSIWEFPGYPRRHPFITDGGNPGDMLRKAIAKANKRAETR